MLGRKKPAAPPGRGGAGEGAEPKLWVEPAGLGGPGAGPVARGGAWRRLFSGRGRLLSAGAARLAASRGVSLPRRALADRAGRA